MSFLETLVILLVAMIVLGPNRLPSAARKIGKFMGAIRRAGDEFKRQLMTMDNEVEQSVKKHTVDFDELVPTDEEMSIMNGEAERSADQSTPSSIPLGTPPSASPDDVWDTPPVPGGLPPESKSESVQVVEKTDSKSDPTLKNVPEVAIGTVVDTDAPTASTSEVKHG